jgi:hypothetical protein
MVPYYMDNRSNSRANTCVKPRLSEGVHLLDSNHQPLGVRFLGLFDGES